MNGRRLHVLLDSGSTYNFFNMQVVQQRRVISRLITDTHVVVGNEDLVSCDGLCCNVAMRIGEVDFTIEAYAIALSGFDLVLGVHFLKTLGPILWDFEGRRMAFWWKNARVLWQGLGSSNNDTTQLSVWALHSVPRSLMDQLLTHFDALFAKPSPCSLERRRCPYGRIVTPTSRRTSWRSNVRPCYRRASFNHPA